MKYTVLTTSTEIILGTRKSGPCQERVFIYFKLQEAIEAVLQLDLWEKDHSRIITEQRNIICILQNLKIYQFFNIFSGTCQS